LDCEEGEQEGEEDIITEIIPPTPSKKEKKGREKEKSPVKPPT